MELIKEKLKAFWNKIEDNKDKVIPVVTAVVGVIVGAVVTSALMNSEEYATEDFMIEDLPEEEEDEIV